ncbi:hypothetical protein ACFOEK_19180 [Litoribrevibacter euphylliae]|uniref:Uncharacterized protein n=1 Tax=Litoribrevibacter euphylliae TaxID=1834034 RepID=A0ABV7HM12_9GAMM
MKKKPLFLLKLSFILVAIISAVPLLELGYCRYVLAGAVDADQVLNYRNGIAFTKGENTPFTGAAYSPVCGGECGFAGCSSLHWYSQFENGNRTESLLPESGNTNDFFSISLFGGYQRVQYDSNTHGT